MKIIDIPRSGSYREITSSHNRNGQYVRNRRTPVNARTAAQLLVRAHLTTNAAGWRALTSGQRAGWTSLGLQMTRTDALGQTYNLTGFQAYLSVNNLNLLVGDAIVAAAPALSTPTGPTSVTLTGATMSIAYLPTPAPAATRVIVRASPQGSAGITFMGDFRFMSVTAAAAASPVVVLTPYTAKFGAPVAGNKIFVAVSFETLGFESLPVVTNAIV
jgi:hypothetical protein